jgi:hypothetical protein
MEFLIKKIVLLFFVTITSVSFAAKINYRVDKTILCTAKSEVINELKKAKQELYELAAPFNETHRVPIKIMTELISYDNVQIYLKDISNCIVDLIINEKKSIESAVREAIQKESQQSKEVYKKFEQLSKKYLEEDILLYTHIYLLTIYLDFTFGIIILNNVLEEIDFFNKI